jgi:hypothetical protein
VHSAAGRTEMTEQLKFRRAPRLRVTAALARRGSRQRDQIRCSIIVVSFGIHIHLALASSFHSPSAPDVLTITYRATWAFHTAASPSPSAPRC